MKGLVYLIGAGPGDPGLFTLRGKKILQKANCVIYDRLVNKSILDFCSDDCEKIYVGKQASHHTLKQEEINRLLITKANQYQHVVRLKGGDVYVFGRGGEEALALNQEGIECQIVPGISSCIAGLAYAGIPITHRGLSVGFQVMTAHDKTDSLTDLDFSKLATSQDTLVFLMGLSKVKEITENLLQAKMNPNTPCAVISQATLPTQKTVCASLVKIHDEVAKAKLVSPALIVVGQVVKLHEELNFFEKLPLFNKKIMIAHPGAETSLLTTLLEAQGAQCEEIKTGHISLLPLTLTKEELNQYHGLIFTSKHGVDSFFAWLLEEKLDARALGNLKVATVGTGTAQRLAHYGIRADFIPELFTSDSLTKQVVSEFQNNQRLLLVKAKNTKEMRLDTIDIAVTMDVIDGYANKPIQITQLAWSDVDLVTFSCASAVQACCENEENLVALQQLPCVSIGPKTSEELRKWGIENIIEIHQSRFEVMTTTIVDYFNRESNYVAS